MTDRGTYSAGQVILAPGRVGADWMGDVAARIGIGLSQRGIEVGVRVEVHNDIMQDLCKSSTTRPSSSAPPNTTTRPEPSAPTSAGSWPWRITSNFVCVNGHAYRDRKSDNTNFAFLSKVVLTDPVTDNQAYGESIGKLATLIGGGKPILQRYGDLKRGRRSTWNRIRNSYIDPTLTNVVCGDIAMALPETDPHQPRGRSRKAQPGRPRRGQRRNPALRPGDQVLRHPGRNRTTIWKPRCGDSSSPATAQVSPATSSLPPPPASFPPKPSYPKRIDIIRYRFLRVPPPRSC